MYVGNLPSIHCARPSVIGQRLVNIVVKCHFCDTGTPESSWIRSVDLGPSLVDPVPRWSTRSLIGQPLLTSQYKDQISRRKESELQARIE